VVDLLLYIGLGIVQVSAATWGGIVSVKSLPPNEKRLPHVLGFILLGLVGVLLISVIGVKNLQAQRESAHTAQTMRDDLAAARQDAKDTKQQLTDSRLAEEFMKGQLSGLSLMVGKIRHTGDIGNKQMAAVLGDIARKTEQAQDTRSSLERMSNPALRQQVIQFTREMLGWSTKQDAIGRNMSDQRMAEIQSISPTDKAKREAVWSAWNLRDNQFYANYHGEFTRDFLGSAIAYRNELLRRLPPQPPLKQAERPAALEGWVAPLSVPVTAIYLQQLAYKLPEK
jgi:hypothetical protein